MEWDVFTYGVRLCEECRMMNIVVHKSCPTMWSPSSTSSDNSCVQEHLPFDGLGCPLTGLVVDLDVPPLDENLKGLVSMPST